MNDRTITPCLLEAFRADLPEAEKSAATISKYMHDVRHFAGSITSHAVTRQNIMDYKAQLAQKYAVTSANSMLASLNAFFCFAG